MDSTKETITLIRAKHPDLCSNGWKYCGVRNEHEKWREEMTSDNSMRWFERAAEYLSGRARRKSIWKGATSYSWKHQAEHYFKMRDGGDAYISNGVFIAAAIALDFKVKRISASPNCFLNISESECYSTRGDGLFLNHHSGKWMTFEETYGA
jgi:hypothetical protein